MDHRKIVGLVGALGVSSLTLAGCASGNKETALSHAQSNNPSSTNSTASESHVGANTTVASAPNHATEITNETELSTPDIRGTLYKDASTAANAISKIQRQSAYLSFAPNNQHPSVNLGLGISAKQDGGLDHYGLQWKEGSWVVEVLWFSGNQGGKQLAKNIVSYLHTHMLPVPHNHGIVIVNSTKPNSRTIKPNAVIAWQEGNELYQLEQNGNPINALKKVVDSSAL